MMHRCDKSTCAEIYTVYIYACVHTAYRPLFHNRERSKILNKIHKINVIYNKKMKTENKAEHLQKSDIGQFNSYKKNDSNTKPYIQGNLSDY